MSGPVFFVICIPFLWECCVFSAGLSISRTLAELRALERFVVLAGSGSLLRVRQIRLCRAKLRTRAQRPTATASMIRMRLNLL